MIDNNSNLLADGTAFQLKQAFHHMSTQSAASISKLNDETETAPQYSVRYRDQIVIILENELRFLGYNYELSVEPIIRFFSVWKFWSGNFE
jgi:hypothetical protein